MMAANYRHIGGGENRLGRHYSRFAGIWPTSFLADQSLTLRKSQNAGSNRPSRANERKPRFHGGMLGQPFQSGEITRPVGFLDPKPKGSAQRHHQERFCKVGVLAERLS